MRAGIICQNHWNIACLAEDGLPLPSILPGLYQAAFFKVATAVIIPVKVTALATVRRFHRGKSSHPGQICAGARVHPNDIAFVHKSGALHFQTGFRHNLFGNACGCIATG